MKGYEIEKDRYVTFEPEEIKAMRPQTSTELDITEFVRLEEIDPIFFETSYYAAPDPGGEKAYALLYRAMSETSYAGLGSLTMHGRERATVVRCGRKGLILHTLYLEKEVRFREEYGGDAALVNDRELGLAKRFVTALSAPFDPTKIKDTFEERLQELIRERAGSAIGAYQQGETPPGAPVVDIMAALRRSLEMVRKPPKAEEGAPKPARRRASNRRS